MHKKTLAQNLSIKWGKLVNHLAKMLDTDTPDLKSVLFLIGVQELGQGPRTFSKREKEELMHIAICRLMSYLGYFELSHQDQDGWPHWKSVKPVTARSSFEQEHLLKQLAIQYFEETLDVEW